jgi:hypothetical protein
MLNWPRFAPAQITVALLALSGCVLPGYEKIEGDTNASLRDSDGGRDAGRSEPDAGPMLAGEACGLSDRLAPTCDACIRAHCCALAEACGEGTACGEDLLEPITPAADFSTDFDALLGCMQRRCDDACQVNWGCLGDYDWPEAEGGVDLEVQVVDFAQVLDGPLEDVTVQACRAIDPACQSGLVAEAVTNAEGKAVLPNLPPDFNGFYSFSGAGYVHSTTQWNEPVHRLGSFRQYQLTPAVINALAVITGVHQTTDEPFDPGVGHLIFRIQNCLPQRFHDNPQPPIAEAENIAISFAPNDGATQVFYTEPSGGVSVTLEATTLDGVGGAFNLLPRNVTVTAVDTVTQREVARGTIRIPQGGIGFMFLLPPSR